MDINKIKLYCGKKVLLVLKNDFKFTTIIPEFTGDSFEIVDKRGQKALISCDTISMIYEKEVENE